VLGVAILAAVFASHGGYRTGHALVAGMNPALLLGAVVVAPARPQPSPSRAAGPPPKRPTSRRCSNPSPRNPQTIGPAVQRTRWQADDGAYADRLPSRSSAHGDDRGWQPSDSRSAPITNKAEPPPAATEAARLCAVVLTVAPNRHTSHIALSDRQSRRHPGGQAIGQSAVMTWTDKNAESGHCRVMICAYGRRGRDACVPGTSRSGHSCR
jgi:hypothetical protein